MAKKKRAKKPKASKPAAPRLLSARQRLFVEEYVKDRNGAAAYRRAGYTAKNDHVAAVGAERLLTKADVREAVEALLGAASEQALVDATWVLTRLRQNVERAMQAVPVTNAVGGETGEYTYEGAVANKALELLGRHLGLFPNKHELTGAAGQPITAKVTHDVAADLAPYLESFRLFAESVADPGSSGAVSSDGTG